MTQEQQEALNAALQPYGAVLTPDGFIARDGRVFGVRLEVAKGRLRMVSRSGDLIASYPTSKVTASVADFVTKFWFWAPRLNSPRTPTV